MDPSYEPGNRNCKYINDVERLAGKLRQVVDLYSQALERIGDSEDEGGQISATLLGNRAMTPVKVRFLFLSILSCTFLH
jgi:DnaJ homolog subfamily C member 7